MHVYIWSSVFRKKRWQRGTWGSTGKRMQMFWGELLLLISLPQLVGLLLGELLRRRITSYVSVGSRTLLKGRLHTQNLLRSVARDGQGSWDPSWARNVAAQELVMPSGRGALNSVPCTFPFPPNATACGSTLSQLTLGQMTWGHLHNWCSSSFWVLLLEKEATSVFSMERTKSPCLVVLGLKHSVNSLAQLRFDSWKPLWHVLSPTMVTAVTLTGCNLNIYS